MALEGPLRLSTSTLQFPLNEQNDMSVASDSEGPPPVFRVSSPSSAADYTPPRPNSAYQLSSSSMNVLGPSDIVGPSPVTSNGTEVTEIEDDASEDIEQLHSTGDSRRTELSMLATNLSDVVRQSSTEEVVSVIQAPESFASWASVESRSSERSTPKHDGSSSLDANKSYQKGSHPSRLPISTDVRPMRYSIDSATPRAQDLQEMLSDDSRLRSSSTSSLEKIDEQTEAEGDEDDDVQDDSRAALRSALQECWTLCNRLAKLSAVHRTRMFHSLGTPDAHEKAWKKCWSLCQRLYRCQDDDDQASSLDVAVNIDLCRGFCQALFDIRQKSDETADSVLRVSFDLNNHLFSGQNSDTLPRLFHERTFDFLVTLSHRLLKQRSEPEGATNRLLSACWDLTQSLHNLCQNKRDDRGLEKELLGLAVDACWDLCDIFRVGWTQMRPDRSTPRPSQMSFFPQQPVGPSGRESRQSTRSSLPSKRGSAKSSSHHEERPRTPAPVPETPVTEFEDTPVSPESRSPQMPNIMVLGASSDSGRGGKWSSNASSMSSYSRTSNRSSSTATTSTATEDPNISHTKLLVLRAAMEIGFDRDTAIDAKSEAARLQSFARDLPAGSFGPLFNHAALLQQFKMSILTDSFLPRSNLLPARGRRAAAHDMAKSVLAMISSSSRYGYLRELFQFVFDFPVEEAENHKNVSIEV